ncbi:uncharacterized protein KY384_002619 [Bacidia gigantensis]|uniref:uncharacterized protein n=1 Tax=Bacidia gigantensis TaxID=2732470 RepID=UPI001D03B2ED|nr:uncharacterized protein KY384_002619 [Bacidia gigantensis]KAG8532742.1 hypothetical protein KY384_002619 [Bacidia gigantensis]
MPSAKLLDNTTISQTESKIPLEPQPPTTKTQSEDSKDALRTTPRQLASPPSSPILPTVLPKVTEEDLRNGAKLDFVSQFRLEEAINDQADGNDSEPDVETNFKAPSNERFSNGHKPLSRNEAENDNSEKDEVLKLSAEQIYELTSSPKSLPLQAPLERAHHHEEPRGHPRETRAKTIGSWTNGGYEDVGYQEGDPILSQAQTTKFEESSTEVLDNSTSSPPQATGKLGRPFSGVRTLSTPLLRGRGSSSKTTESTKPLGRQNKGAPPALKFEGLSTTGKFSSVDGAEPSPMPQSIPVPPLSLPTYLQLELSSDHPSPLYIHRSATSDFPYESSRVKIERLKNFMLLPPQLEQVLWFGALACMDAWLYSFTILPLRFIKALTLLIHSGCRNILHEGREILSYIYVGSGRMLARHRAGSHGVSPAVARTPATAVDERTPTRPTAERPERRLLGSSQPKSRKSHVRHHRTKSVPSTLQPDHKADILKGLLILLSTTILMCFDASRMYHGIRGQAAIKLYVIYNVLEVCDRLFSALGQDVLESLFSRETLERKADGRSKVLRPFWLFILALVYNLVHSTSLFYQVITLNVAVNSYSNALLTLLMSNQFVEIKSTVFKKFEKENLFQLTCADVVERFQLWLMLMIIASRNIVETGGLSLAFSGGSSTGDAKATSGSSILPSAFTLLPSWSGQVLAPFFLVLGSEMLVDWIKHSYIAKFNNTKPAVYGRFLDVLAKDYYSNAFTDPNLTRRLGLPVIPLACLFIRASVQTYHMLLATYAPPPIPSTATSLSIDSATTSPATTAALAHIDNIFRHALYHSTSSHTSPWPYYLLDSLLPYLVPLTTLLLMFIFLLSIKVMLGMALLSFARSRYRSMKEREGAGTHAEGRRVGGWGVVEVDEDKRRWIYADDPEGATRLREREVRDSERMKSVEHDDFGGVSRYNMGNSLINGQFKRIVAEPTGVPQQDWINTVPNDGFIYYRSLLNMERLMPTTPQVLAEILSYKSYDFAKPSTLRAGLGRILGVGLVLAEGDEHRMQRKNLMPAFAFRHVKDCYPIFWDKSCKLVARLMTEEVGSQTKESLESGPVKVEIANWISRATLDIIGTAGFGKDFNALDDPENELNATYRKVLQPTRAGQMLAFMGMVLPSWLIRSLPVATNNNIAQAAEYIKKVARQLIGDKKEKIRLEGKRTETDILSVALESGGFTDEELVNQLMTFLVAGHETTATAMTWGLYLLCQNPSIQTRLREEIRATIPSIEAGEKMTPQTLESCSYLHACCNEILRLYAPLPLTVREAVRDTTIMGQPIAKGTKVFTCVWAINTSTKLWGPDAASFNPDRWMGAGRAGNGGADSNYSYMTFLHGPRSCIGQAFAKAEFACLLAALVGRFEFELVDKEMEIRIKGGITARPRDGLTVNMKPIDGW